MSTTIYNAYKIAKEADLMDILRDIKEMHIQYNKDFFSRLPNYTITTKEGAKTFLELSESNFGEYYLSDFFNSEMRKGENTPSNIEASAVVYEYDNIKTVQLFGLPREVDKMVKEKYIKTGLLIDYHYQNQVDQSNYDWDKEDYSEIPLERQMELDKDWEERRIYWEGVYGDRYIPSECGLCFEFHPTRLMFQFCRDILEHVKKNN